MLLCLDADPAGQEAMARSAAAVRTVEGTGAKLRSTPVELLVAPLPAGSDPADVIQRRRLSRDAGDPRPLRAVYPLPGRARDRARRDRHREGRDKVLSEVAGLIAALPQSVLRDELIQLVSGRLALSDALVAAALATPPATGSQRPAAANGNSAPGVGARRALDRREEAEYSFLALCIAHPTPGAQRLSNLDVEAVLASPLARRAAAHLRDHIEAPSRGIAPEDEQLRALIAELVMRAREAEDSPPVELSRAALHLDLARLDRDIAAARVDGDPLEDLARERQRVLGELRKFVS